MDGRGPGSRRRRLEQRGRTFPGRTRSRFGPLPSRAPAPEPDADLATELARSSPAVTTATSVNALLEVWGEEPTASELMSLPQALAILESRGLAVVRLQGASPATLEQFNYPAILELSALDGMPRFVLLAGLEGEYALIAGIADGRPLRVPFAQIGDHWGGNAWLAWRDFEELPEILRPPASGAPVVWLQRVLGHLGFYDGEATGEFDAATIKGVRDLQASLQIQVDGTVGRRDQAQAVRDARALPAPAAQTARRGDRLSTILRALQRLEGEKGGGGEMGGLGEPRLPAMPRCPPMSPRWEGRSPLADRPGRIPWRGPARLLPVVVASHRGGRPAVRGVGACDGGAAQAALRASASAGAPPPPKPGVEIAAARPAAPAEQARCFGAIRAAAAPPPFPAGEPPALPEQVAAPPPPPIVEPAALPEPAAAPPLLPSWSRCLGCRLWKHRRRRTPASGFPSVAPAPAPRCGAAGCRLAPPPRSSSRHRRPPSSSRRRRRHPRPPVSRRFGRRK